MFVERTAEQTLRVAARLAAFTLARRSVQGAVRTNKGADALKVRRQPFSLRTRSGPGSNCTAVGPRRLRCSPMRGRRLLKSRNCPESSWRRTARGRLAERPPFSRSAVTVPVTLCRSWPARSVSRTGMLPVALSRGRLTRSMMRTAQQLCRWTLTARRAGRPGACVRAKALGTAQRQPLPSTPLTHQQSERRTISGRGSFVTSALLRSLDRATDRCAQASEPGVPRSAGMAHGLHIDGGAVERGIVACSPHQVWAVGQARSGAARFGEHVTRATDRNVGLSR